MLVDGGFEARGLRDNTWTHYESVGGWQTDTRVEIWGDRFLGHKASEGSNFAELDFDRRASNLYQEVETVDGAEYAFSFDAAMRAKTASATNTIEVYWNGEFVGSVTPESTEWTSYELTVVGTGGEDRIEFREEAGDVDLAGRRADDGRLPLFDLRRQVLPTLVKPRRQMQRPLAGLRTNGARHLRTCEPLVDGRCNRLQVAPTFLNPGRQMQRPLAGLRTNGDRQVRVVGRLVVDCVCSRWQELPTLLNPVRQMQRPLLGLRMKGALQRGVGVAVFLRRQVLPTLVKPRRQMQRPDAGLRTNGARHLRVDGTFVDCVCLRRHPLPTFVKLGRQMQRPDAGLKTYGGGHRRVVVTAQRPRLAFHGLPVGQARKS